jgi:hypothetical protein
MKLYEPGYFEQATRAAIRGVLNEIEPYKKQTKLLQALTAIVKDEVVAWALDNSSSRCAAARRIGVNRNTIGEYLKKKTHRDTN